MKSEQYWQSRAAKRMYEYQRQADKAANDIAEAYIKATEQINSEVETIFRTFRINGGLSEEEAKKLLNELPDDTKLKSLKEIVQKVKDPKQRQTLLSQINSPAYAYRIKRFEQLQQDIDKQAAQLANIEQNTSRVHYIDLANEAYNRVIFDIQQGTGIGFSFSRMPVSRIKAILEQNWSGQLFSERIWKRADNLNRTIKQELLAQFMTGRSYKKTAKEIEEQMAVSSMAARCLIRTESTYVANCAEIESYNECGIDKFKFVATLDMRTSDICQQMDGKEFSVEDASPGTNVPPLHPWCRSTTIAVIDGTVTENLKRRARDPKTGKNYKVPADMTYSQWKKEYVDKSDESGIIEMKRVSESKQFKPLKTSIRERMFAGLRKNGADIIIGEQAEEYLNYKSKLEKTYIEATSLGNVMMFRKNPSASAVFEESIHFYQYKQGRIKTGVLDELEIEAAEKMIKHQKAYHITEEEIIYTKKRLEILKRGE